MLTSSQEKTAEDYVVNFCQRQKMEEEWYLREHMHQTEYQDQPILSKGEGEEISFGHRTSGVGDGSMGDTNMIGQ